MAKLDMNPEGNLYEFLNLFEGQLQFCIKDEHNTVLPMNITRALPVLTKANLEGYDIYFTVSLCKPGSRRRKIDFIKARALFLDDDGDKHGKTDPSEFPLPPNITVQSSPGKYHYYWLTSTEDKDEFEAVERSLIERHHGDPAVCDCTRYMRLPGFIHNKSGALVSATIHHTDPYDWGEIKEAWPPKLAEVHEFTGEYSEFNFAEAKRNILMGHEIHFNRRGLGMHYANIGVSEENAVAELIDLVKLSIELGNCDEARGKERIANMAADVAGAYKKVAEERNVVAIRSETKANDKYTRLPIPSGGLKTIVEDVLRHMEFPSNEMAIIVAQHVVGVFCGGLYRFRKSVGNRKRTILAPSTRGKSIAGNYYREIVRKMACQDTVNVIDIHRYDASGAYTPANLHSDFFNHRIRGSIVNEAGLDGQSRAGMSSDQRRQWMDILTMGYKAVLTSKQYSKNNQQSKSLNAELVDCYGVVGIQIAESVAQNFVEVLHKNNAFISGDVGRQELVFVDPVKPAKNYEAGDVSVSEEIIAALYGMVRKFEDIGALGGNDPANPDRFEAIDPTEVMEAYVELDKEKTKAYNKFVNDPVRQALSGRFMERLETTILVQVQADLAFGILDKPKATMEHFNYAVKYQEELDRSLTAQMDGGALADPLTRCVERVAARMDDFGMKGMDSFALDRKSRTVSSAWITKVLDSCSDWKELIAMNFNKRNSAKYELIAALEDQQILIPLDTGNSKVKKWRLNR